MKNRFCEMLGIRYPIIQGGMAWSSDGTLAAAVSNAGGAGIIGTGGRTTEWVEEEIKKAKSLTDKPFGVNLMLMAPNVKEIADVVCREKVAFVTTGAGSPVPWIEPMHKAGIKVIPVVPNVKLAKRIATSGADAMVIEGMEGGGHIGTLTVSHTCSCGRRYFRRTRNGCGPADGRRRRADGLPVPCDNRMPHSRENKGNDYQGNRYGLRGNWLFQKYGCTVSEECLYAEIS